MQREMEGYDPKWWSLSTESLFLRELTPDDAH